MNEDEARRAAWKVLGEVEEMMSGAGVAVLAPGDEAGRQRRAYFEDREYYQLEDAVVEILMGANSDDSNRSGNDTAAPEHVIKLTLCESDFEHSMGRKPRNEEEFEEWALLCEKGLCNGHIDWDIVYECAADAMDEREPSSDRSGDGDVLGVG